MNNKGCPNFVIKSGAVDQCNQRTTYSGLCNRHLKDLVELKKRHLKSLEEYELKRNPNDNNHIRSRDKIVRWLTLYREWLLRHPDKALELE